MDTDFQQALKSLDKKLDSMSEKRANKKTKEDRLIKTAPSRPKRHPQLPRSRRVGPDIPRVKRPRRTERHSPEPLESHVAVESIGNRIRKDIRPATFGVMQYMDSVKDRLSGGSRQTQFGRDVASTGFGRRALGGAKGRLIKEGARAKYLGDRAVSQSVGGLGAARHMSPRKPRK